MNGQLTMEDTSTTDVQEAVQKLLEAPTAPQSATELMQEQTLLISVKFHRMGLEKKVVSEEILKRKKKEKSEEETGLAVSFEDEGDEPVMDPAMVKAAKLLLDAPELKEIKQLDTRARNYMRRRSYALPKYVHPGFYMVPIGLVEQVDTELTKYKEERAALVENFLAVYSQRILEAQQRLGPQFFIGDYPAAPIVKSLFEMEWRYHPAAATAGNLATVSSLLYKRETQKVHEECQAMVEDVRKGLRAYLFQLVEHLTERLGYQGEGKKKVFKDTTVTQFKDFLSVFDEMNITGDTELKALADKAKKLVAGVDPKHLREDTSIRDHVRTEMEKVKEALKPMIVDAGPRFFSFGT